MGPAAPISAILGDPLTAPATVAAVEAIAHQGVLLGHLLNHGLELQQAPAYSRSTTNEEPSQWEKAVHLWDSQARQPPE